MRTTVVKRGKYDHSVRPEEGEYPFCRVITLYITGNKVYWPHCAVNRSVTGVIYKQLFALLRWHRIRRETDERPCTAILVRHKVPALIPLCPADLSSIARVPDTEDPNLLPSVIWGNESAENRDLLRS